MEILFMFKQPHRLSLWCKLLTLKRCLFVEHILNPMSLYLFGVRSLVQGLPYTIHM